MPSDSVSLERKVSVLFIGEEPKDRPGLDLTREIEALTRELEQRAPGRFQLVSRWGVPVTELLDLLELYTPDVLHFGGHGLDSGELAFEGEDGHTHAPAPAAVARVFEHYEGRVRCVVLNACHGEAQTRLIAAHADTVIGMSDRIFDHDALAFARAFYKELGKDKSVAVAFERAKNTLELRGSQAQDVLVLCPRAGVDPAEVFVSREPTVEPLPLSPGPADALVTLKGKLEQRARAGGDVSELEAQILEVRRQIRSGPALDVEDILGKRYVLDSVLGTGGFATVWKAFDRVQNKLVAVKVLHGQWTRDESRVDRFVSGAKRLGELRHPRVVSVVEAPSRDSEHVYCVMPLLAGGDLRRAVLGEDGLDRRVALAVVADALEGLVYAHEQGVIHRDVKPGNILVDEHRRGYMTDFDLAHAKDSTQGTRTAGMGTFGYAAPEQQRDAKRVDERADVYSAAMCVLFVLLGKDPPVFVARTEPDVLDGLECGDLLRATLRGAVTYTLEERTTTCEHLMDALRVEAWWPSDVFWAEDGDGASLRVGGIEQRMRWIPAGEFVMGSPADEVGRSAWEGPQHDVTLTEGFWIADTPCTQDLWEAVMGSNPSQFRSPCRPVEHVSWEDAHRFLERLNAVLEDGGFALPNEAQWEYACRAGTTTATYAGPIGRPMETSGDQSGPVVDQLAWYGDRSGKTQEVRQKRPNPWGLYDMLGNVSEWCADGMREYGRAVENDPVGPVDGIRRIFRGGCSTSDAHGVRSAYRNLVGRSTRAGVFGFRWVRQLPQGVKPVKEKSVAEEIGEEYPKDVRLVTSPNESDSGSVTELVSAAPVTDGHDRHCDAERAHQGDGKELERKYAELCSRPLHERAPTTPFAEVAQGFRDSGRHLAAAFAALEGHRAAWGTEANDVCFGFLGRALDDLVRELHANPEDSWRRLVTLQLLIQNTASFGFVRDAAKILDALRTEARAEYDETLARIGHGTPDADDLLISGFRVEGFLDTDWHLVPTNHEVLGGAVSRAHGAAVQVRSMDSRFRNLLALADYDGASKLARANEGALTSPGLRGWSLASEAHASEMPELFADAATQFELDTVDRFDRNPGQGWFSSINQSLWGPYFRSRNQMGQAANSPLEAHANLRRAATYLPKIATSWLVPEVIAYSHIVRSVVALGDGDRASVAAALAGYHKDQVALASWGPSEQVGEFLGAVAEFSDNRVTDRWIPYFTQLQSLLDRVPIAKSDRATIATALNVIVPMSLDGMARGWEYRALQAINDERQLHRILLALFRVEAATPLYSQIRHGPLEYGKDIVVCRERGETRELWMYSVKLGPLRKSGWNREVRPQLEEMFQVPLDSSALPDRIDERVGVLVWNDHVRPHADPIVNGWLREQRETFGRRFELMNIDRLVRYVRDNDLGPSLRRELRVEGLLD